MLLSVWVLVVFVNSIIGAHEPSLNIEPTSKVHHNERIKRDVFVNGVPSKMLRRNTNNSDVALRQRRWADVTAMQGKVEEKPTNASLNKVGIVSPSVPVSGNKSGDDRWDLTDILLNRGEAIVARSSGNLSSAIEENLARGDFHVRPAESSASNGVETTKAQRSADNNQGLDKGLTEDVKGSDQSSSVDKCHPEVLPVLLKCNEDKPAVTPEPSKNVDKAKSAVKSNADKVKLLIPEPSVSANGAKPVVPSSSNDKPAPKPTETPDRPTISENIKPAAVTLNVTKDAGRSVNIKANLLVNESPNAFALDIADILLNRGTAEKNNDSTEAKYKNEITDIRACLEKSDPGDPEACRYLREEVNHAFKKSKNDDRSDLVDFLLKKYRLKHPSAEPSAEKNLKSDGNRLRRYNVNRELLRQIPELPSVRPKSVFSSSETFVLSAELPGPDKVESINLQKDAFPDYSTNLLDFSENMQIDSNRPVKNNKDESGLFCTNAVHGFINMTHRVENLYFIEDGQATGVVQINTKNMCRPATGLSIRACDATRPYVYVIPKSRYEFTAMVIRTQFVDTVSVTISVFCL